MALASEQFLAGISSSDTAQYLMSSFYSEREVKDCGERGFLVLTKRASHWTTRQTLNRLTCVNKARLFLTGNKAQARPSVPADKRLPPQVQVQFTLDSSSFLCGDFVPLPINGKVNCRQETNGTERSASTKVSENEIINKVHLAGAQREISGDGISHCAGQYEKRWEICWLSAFLSTNSY